MPGFILVNTLSDNGSVTRGVCTVDDNNNLASIVETSNIYKDGNGGGYVEKKDGTRRAIDPESLVSMNISFPRLSVTCLRRARQPLRC